MKKSLFCAAVFWASPALATTYYVAPTGSDANTCSQAAPCRQIRRPLALVGPGDTILVADGSYLGFDVRDVHGTPAAPIVIKAAGTGAVVVPTTDRRDNRDTIFVTFSSHVVLDGLRSFGANRAAVRVDESPRVTIRNGVFGDNTTWGIFTDFSDDLLIENNECYGSRVEHGIYVSNSGDRPVVRGNRVHHNAASGIQLNADIESGGDGIITGALLERNLIWSNGVRGGAGLNLDGVQDSVVRNNLLYDNHATGIVNYQGNGAEGPRGMQILHNTIDQAANGRWALLIHNTTGPMLVRNNILHNRHSFRGSIEFGNPQDAARTDSDYNVMGRVSTDEGSTALTLAQWQAQGRDPHSLGAPLASLFVNPAVADYHLAAASPARDRGQTLAQVTTDLEGRPRPAGTASDIGAYEAGAAPAVPSLSVGDVSLPEGNSGTANAVFAVRLSAPSSQTVTVAYATADGTALAGSDYLAAAGTLTFAPGSTEQTLVVAVNGDTTPEADETLLVTLGAAQNATIADGQGQATLRNDDGEAARMLTPPPGSRLPGSQVTFTWSSGTAVQQYWIFIGTQRGAANIYSASQGLRRSVTISGLPTNGRTLWVRLFSRINGAWRFNDHTYVAAGP